MGPEQTPMYLDPVHYPPGVGTGTCDYCLKTGSDVPCTHLLALPGFPYQHSVLPQTNLTNLAQVSNQPPERFLVKDPHLLKPPAALLGVGSGSYTRRASDGGAGWRGPQEATDPTPVPPQPAISSASLSPPTRHQSTGSEDSAEQLCLAAKQTLLDANLAAAANAAAVAASAVAADSSSSSSPNEVVNASSSQRPESPSPYSVQVEQFLKRNSGPESPRRRRTGLDTVLEPPEISPELAQEVEIRMKQQQQQQQHTSSSVEAMDQSPSFMAPPPFVPPPLSPSGSSVGSGSSGGGSSLRTRRTGLSGLSTVMEVSKSNGGNGGHSSSLHLPAGRYSPVQRRLSDGSPASRASGATGVTASGQQGSLPSSGDPSPGSDVRALQEECRRLTTEAAAAAAASSYEAGLASSPNNFLLRPPSPADLSGGGGGSALVRRSSDSGVSSHLSPPGGVGHRLRPSVSSHSATSEPMQQLYDDMYNTGPSSPASCASPHLTTPATGSTSR